VIDHDGTGADAGPPGFERRGGGERERIRSATQGDQHQP
jgi:hypothetical protein